MLSRKLPSVRFDMVLLESVPKNKRGERSHYSSLHDQFGGAIIVK